jgi:two-component system phosphate regulon sensor histidine kinase PhoR
LKQYAGWGIVSATNMQPKPFIKSFSGLSLILSCLIILTALIAARSLKEIFITSQISPLQKAAEALSLSISAVPISERQEELKKNAELLAVEISVITPDGMQAFSTKPKTHNYVFDYSFFSDVKSALSGIPRWIESSDYHENTRKFFISVPVIVNGEVKYALRLEKESAGLIFNLNAAYAAIITVTLAGILCICICSLVINRRITNSFQKLTQSVRKFTEGDLKSKLYYNEKEVEESLALELNKMAEQIDERLHAAVSRKNELEAVFSGMREGVLLIGTNQKIIKINNAAYEMLGTVNTEVEGKSIEETVRNINLLNYIRNVLKNRTPEEVELHLHEKKEMIVQVYSSLIPDKARDRTVLMLVLNDITPLKQLETVRKDFVANVSHELKTPITSIQGFVETLLDGAMYKPDETKRFLEIIYRQTERLNSIFNDLLALARLEKESGNRAAQLVDCDLVSLTKSVLQVCHVEAAKKEVTFNLDGLEVKNAKADASLLEQALVNLVSNAIKFSTKGKEIKIISKEENSMLKISVEDSGMGIEQTHLNRIFERFYRVDQARTREEGGTGLGLSIVKHIALAHDGGVEVESTLGKGSKFSILIPQPIHN